jgi:hypothetical protein
MHPSVGIALPFHHRQGMSIYLRHLGLRRIRGPLSPPLVQQAYISPGLGPFRANAIYLNIQAIVPQSNDSGRLSTA